jgi:hypothetical protein
MPISRLRNSPTVRAFKRIKIDRIRPNDEEKTISDKEHVGLRNTFNTAALTLVYPRLLSAALT